MVNPRNHRTRSWSHTRGWRSPAAATYARSRCSTSFAPWGSERRCSPSPQIRRERGFGVLSLIVFEQNAGAVRLYEREGFRVVDRAAVVPHGLIQHTGDVLLMAMEV